MNVQEIVEAIISKKHGWAVAEQFTSTWEDPSIENIWEQNFNALNYIKGTIDNLAYFGDDIFTEDVIEELKDYLSKLTKAMETEEDEE